MRSSATASAAACIGSLLHPQAQDRLQRHVAAAGVAAEQLHQGRESSEASTRTRSAAASSTDSLGS